MGRTDAGILRENVGGEVSTLLGTEARPHLPVKWLGVYYLITVRGEVEALLLGSQTRPSRAPVG